MVWFLPTAASCHSAPLHVCSHICTFISVAWSPYTVLCSCGLMLSHGLLISAGLNAGQCVLGGPFVAFMGAEVQSALRVFFKNNPHGSCSWQCERQGTVQACLPGLFVSPPRSSLQRTYCLAHAPQCMASLPAPWLVSLVQGWIDQRIDYSFCFLHERARRVKIPWSLLLYHMHVGTRQSPGGLCLHAQKRSSLLNHC
jgi:hypothetical protein